jgi:hypothetical protein
MGTLREGWTRYLSSFGMVEREHEFRGDNGLVYKVFPCIPRGRVLVCMNSVRVVVCHACGMDVVECADEKYACPVQRPCALLVVVCLSSS